MHLHFVLGDSPRYRKTVLIDRFVLDVGGRQVMGSAGLKADEKIASLLRRQLFERRSFVPSSYL
jgi:hypothetical protein